MSEISSLLKLPVRFGADKQSKYDEHYSVYDDDSVELFNLVDFELDTCSGAKLGRFLVEAINSYEANQAQIKELEATADILGSQCRELEEARDYNAELVNGRDERIKELESGIESMGLAFVEFIDSLQALGLELPEPALTLFNKMNKDLAEVNE